MNKLPIRELQRLAFLHAECDAQGLADAWPRTTEEHRKYSDLAEQFRQYRIQRWGETKFEVDMKNAKSVNMTDLGLTLLQKEHIKEK